MSERPFGSQQKIKKVLSSTKGTNFDVQAIARGMSWTYTSLTEAPEDIRVIEGEISIPLTTSPSVTIVLFQLRVSSYAFLPPIALKPITPPGVLGDFCCQRSWVRPSRSSHSGQQASYSDFILPRIRPSPQSPFLVLLLGILRKLLSLTVATTWSGRY
jgi:hypothetical protein